MNQNKPEQELAAWRKKIEMISIDIKGLDRQLERGRLELKTKSMNQHFINELDKIGLELINIKTTVIGRQQCPDGSTPNPNGNCPTPPPSPQIQTCPHGSVIDASATCPQEQQPQTSPPPDQHQRPSVDCNANPNDPSCTPPPSGS